MIPSSTHDDDMADEDQGQVREYEQRMDMHASDTIPQRNANLARIRDNQRRSRARRKEYLQELETKYRTCEQVGVEASAEIQAAARRVLDENKRLRELLRQQGLSDAEIDGMSVDRPENPQYPTAANALESMMGQRRSCGSGDDCGSSVDDGRPSIAPSLSTQSMSAPQLPAQQPQPQHMTPQMIPPSTRFASPHSSVSSGVPTPNNAHFPALQASSYSLSPLQQSHMDNGMHYNDSITWDMQQQQLPQPSMGDSSSCYAAAGAIRTIKPDIGYELEYELGCGDGADCNVPNTKIFSMMDRYSGGV